MELLSSAEFSCHDSRDGDDELVDRREAIEEVDFFSESRELQAAESIGEYRAGASSHAESSVNVSDTILKVLLVRVYDARCCFFLS